MNYQEVRAAALNLTREEQLRLVEEMRELSLNSNQTSNEADGVDSSFPSPVNQNSQENFYYSQERRSLEINRFEFEQAFDYSDHAEFIGYLDNETGKVIYIRDEITSALEDIPGLEVSLEADVALIQNQPDLQDWIRAEMLEALHIQWDIEENRYIEIPRPWNSHDDYQDMVDFVDTLQDKALKQLFIVALDGSGAFGRFRSVLSSHADVQDRWERFSGERKLQRMTVWCHSEGIEPEFT